MSDETLSAQPAGVSPLAAKRLRKNANGYFGETIDISGVLNEIAAAALGQAWNVQRIRDIRAGTGELPLLALTRVGKQTTSDGNGKRYRVYLSTGIHGDEPAGPLAVLQLLQENKWATNLDLWLCPCLNPAGFHLNRRENAHGTDLNRQYLEPTAPETIAHLDWLKQQPRFDLCLCLHEDWESHGFYVYELNPDGRRSLAESMVAEVSKVCPIDTSDVIEGRPAREGVIRPSIDPRTRPQWPEAFFLLTHKTRLSYTLEAPSDFPLAMRVAALVTAAQTAIGEFVEPNG